MILFNNKLTKLYNKTCLYYYKTMYILIGQIIFLDIYTMNENISETFKIILERYGAKIEKNLNKKCNLVVWKGYIIIKDGNEKNITKA